MDVDWEAKNILPDYQFRHIKVENESLGTIASLSTVRGATWRPSKFSQTFCSSQAYAGVWVQSQTIRWTKDLVYKGLRWFRNNQERII